MNKTTAFYTSIMNISREINKMRIPKMTPIITMYDSIF